MASSGSLILNNQSEKHMKGCVAFVMYGYYVTLVLFIMHGHCLRQLISIGLLLLTRGDDNRGMIGDVGKGCG